LNEAKKSTDQTVEPSKTTSDDAEKPKKNFKFWDLYMDVYGKKRKKNSDFREMKLHDIGNFFVVIGAAVAYYYYSKSQSKKKDLESKYEWLKLPCFKHKLFICNGFCLPQYLSKDLESYKSFKLRNDDVINQRF
jgi:hypothetical protein